LNEAELRERLRRATDPATGGLELRPVTRRARVLRLRRVAAVVVTAALAIAAIAVPLKGLQHLGESPASSPQPATEPQASLGFEPLDGWITSTYLTPSFSRFGEPASAAAISNVKLEARDPESVYPPGLTNNQLDALPAHGIAVEAEQILFTRNALPTGAGYPERSLPVDLRDATSSTGGGEGLSRTDLTSYHLNATVNGHPIIVQAWFGTADPSPDLLRQAQLALNHLVVVPATPTTDAIDDLGVTMTLPEGWHGLLYSYGDGAANLVVSSADAVDVDWEKTRATLGPTDIAVVMQESRSLVELQGWVPLQGHVAIGPYDLCDGCELLDDGRPPVPAHVLYQDTFTTGGRAFDLYVEFGSTPTQTDIDQMDAVLATLAFGSVSNPSYTPGPGSTRVGPIYDGEDRPEVTASDQDRTLSWAYEHASMAAPDGWTGQVYPVSGLERPISLLAAATWSFTPGGYCGPLNALRELPNDGALVWLDGYRSNPPVGLSFAPKPTTVNLADAATDPSPCFGGSSPFVFRWSIGGRYVVAHAALGPDASGKTVADAEASLESVSVG
jgi:hypothetical protein